MGSIIFLSFGCSKNSTSENITIAAAINAYSGPFYVASEKNYWAAEGLVVEEKFFTSGRLCLDALLAGAADIVTVAETPIVFAGMSNQNVAIVATMSSATNDLKVIARRDHGINDPTDLRGKKIAMLFGATSEYYGGLFLSAYGISFDDVKRVNLNPSDMPIALINGDIDAYVIWEPFVYNGFAKLGHEKAIKFIKKDIYTLPFNIAVRKDYADKNPEIVKSALRAIISANDFIREQPNEAIKIIAEKTGMETSVLSDIWEDYEFNVKLHKDLPDALIREAKWAIKAGLAPPNSVVPDYTNFINAKLLRSIDEKRVTLH